MDVIETKLKEVHLGPEKEGKTFVDDLRNEIAEYREGMLNEQKEMQKGNLQDSFQKQDPEKLFNNRVTVAMEYYERQHPGLSNWEEDKKSLSAELQSINQEVLTNVTERKELVEMIYEERDKNIDLITQLSEEMGFDTSQKEVEEKILDKSAEQAVVNTYVAQMNAIAKFSNEGREDEIAKQPLNEVGLSSTISSELNQMLEGKNHVPPMLDSKQFLNNDLLYSVQEDYYNTQDRSNSSLDPNVVESISQKKEEYHNLIKQDLEALRQSKAPIVKYTIGDHLEELSENKKKAMLQFLPDDLKELAENKKKAFEALEKADMGLETEKSPLLSSIKKLDSSIGEMKEYNQQNPNRAQELVEAIKEEKTQGQQQNSSIKAKAEQHFNKNNGKDADFEAAGVSNRGNLSNDNGAEQSKSKGLSK